MNYRYSPDNPFRQPDWRWQLAHELLAAPRPASRRAVADPWVGPILRFARAFERCDGDDALSALAERQPAMFWAHHVYHHSEAEADPRPGQDPGPNLLRSELEARLVAGEEPMKIAAKVRMSPMAVEAYGRTFYDLGLVTPSVVARLVGSDLSRMARENDYDRLWKWMGFHMGPPVLDAMIWGLPAGRRVNGYDEVMPALADATRMMITRRALLTAISFQATSMNAPEILAQFVKLDEQDRGARGHASEEAKNQALVQTLQAMSPSMRRDGDPLAPAPGSVYDVPGVELPAGPRLALEAAGGAEATLQADFADYKFPPPASASATNGALAPA